MNYLNGFAAPLAASIAGTLALLFLARRIPAANRLRSNNDVLGVYFTLIGTIYAIVMAFMLASVWTRFDQASSQAEQEAATLVNMFHLADGLPEADRSRLQTEVRDYARLVISKEWPTMQQGQSDPQADKLHHQLWHDAQALQPRTNHDTNIHAQLLQQLTTLATLRRLRLLVSKSGLPNILWFVLIAGAALLIVITALYGEDPYPAHGVKAALLATILALILYAIWEIDGPFQGSVTVTPDAFVEAVKVCAEPRP